MYLPWVRVSQSSPYFITDDGKSWTPVGHNDAIPWASLAGLYRRRDVAAVEAYLDMLAACGVTALRLMLEYCETDEHYLENPAGAFVPETVRFWDDLLPMCASRGIRVLLTPLDTFWMYTRWERHPYNCANGGPCAGRDRILICPDTRNALRRRLEFATRRWGASGVIFGWDLFNEIHPCYGGDSAEPFDDFITDVSTFLRDLELRIHGRAHLQTVSMFTPHIVLDAACIKPAIYAHPSLDFASTHFYDEGTIDFPWNTVDPAIAMGRLTREALAEVPPLRPFFDSENGPIHSFKDWKITLDADYDTEVFRHMQWAHLASGGAGGGMRWPNREPHVLTPGMHDAQRTLAAFLPLIDWTTFERRNLNEEVSLSTDRLAVCACGDSHQAVVWVLRKDWEYGGRLEEDGRGSSLPRGVEPVRASITVPDLQPAWYNITAWDTFAGTVVGEFRVAASAGGLCFETPGVVTDMAFAIRKAPNPD